MNVNRKMPPLKSETFSLIFKQLPGNIESWVYGWIASIIVVSAYLEFHWH